MRSFIRKAYTFDDVALVPQFNNIPSRLEPNLESWLTKSRRIKIPLLAANMDSVIGENLADLLINEGTIPIFHRFTHFERQKEWVTKYTDQTFISCGLNIEKKEEVIELLKMGASGVCIDVAHGHSDRMFRFIADIKKACPEKEVIAGNVCTAMAYHDLVNAGADAVKVGIGPGSACKTRVVTGFGVPQFTAIQECAEVAEKLRIPLIADGGIRSSRDVVLALAAGASSVMMGKLFALTHESAAPKRMLADQKQAKYRGQASQNFQEEFYGGLKENTVAEGVDFWANVEYSALDVIHDILGGLRSAMTYGGSRNLKELQRKAEFVEVTSTYAVESFPRQS